MSIRVMSWVWAESAADGPDLLVLLAIADQAHDDGGGAWPSVATLAAKARVSGRTVQRCIRRLVEIGELQVNAGAGRNGVNVYRVLMGATTGHPVTESPRHPVSPSAGHEGVTPVSPGGDSAVTRTVLEPSLPVHKLSSSATADTALDRPEVEQLCNLLADLIEQNGSKRPPVTKRWRDSARLLIDADHRTAQQIENAIRWCQQDDFWRSNVLSMPKLREKYDQLRLAAQRGTQPKPSTTNQRVMDGAALAQRLRARENALELTDGRYAS